MRERKKRRKNQMKNKKEHIREVLSQFLGTDSEDIADEDSLINDLHIKPTELSDFLKTLEEEGFDTVNVDLTEIDTFEDLTENLTNDEYLD
jgi:acyl carrier protein